jgi:hypothetical protein
MSDKHKDDMPGTAIAAMFQSREEAKRAIGALHKAHFKKTWFGTTSVAVDASGEEKITTESSGGGLFSNDAGSLVDALVKYDVDGDTARRIEAEAQPGCAIVAVKPPDDGKHEPSEAMEILSRYGGKVQGRSLAGAGVGSAGSTYSPLGDDDFDDSLVYEETTFYRR